jgi:hypothetical protein
MKRLHRRFDDMMNGIIAERRTRVVKTAGDGEGKDLLGLLLAMVQEDKSLTGSEEDKITDTDIKALILVPLMLMLTSLISSLKAKIGQIHIVLYSLTRYSLQSIILVVIVV